MANFLQTLSRETAKLKFRDFVTLGALAAILSQSLRKKKPKTRLTGFSVPLKDKRRKRRRNKSVSRK